MQNTRLKPEDSYYAHLRMPLLELIKGRPKRILEIGCGHGQSLVFLKRNSDAEFAAGVELVPEVAAIARKNPEVDLVLTGDIEQIFLDFPSEYFDLIIVGHVLEHVKDPWAVTKRLGGLLTAGGQLIGSLPNVRNVLVSLPLVFFGKWQYTDEGILDWTHTKFFTKNTIDDLLLSSGFKIRRINPEFSPKAAFIDKMTVGFFKDLLCFTYNFSAEKPVSVS